STRVINAVGLYNIEIGIDSETGYGQSLGDIVEKWVSDFSSANLSALGWFGLLLVVYSAIGLMVTIENSFNGIYGAPEGRSWLKRVPMYWAVLTLGPAFIGITVYIDSLFGQWIENRSEEHTSELQSRSDLVC